jgi:hypothetical protein
LRPRSIHFHSLQIFFYVFVNSPLSVHLMRLHIITFFSLQTNSRTHYTAPETVTASLDYLIGRQLSSLNKAFVISQEHGSVHIAPPKLAIRHTDGPQVRCLSSSLPAVYQIITPAPSVTLVYSS